MLEQELHARLTAAGIGDAGFSLTTERWSTQLVFGAWRPDHVEHLMSSSKWLTALTVMSLVDDGLLELGAPVAAYLDGFVRHDDAKAAITVRHCLSLTSGLRPRHPSIMDATSTLEESVACIAAEPLLAAPGAALIYGGNGFQVLGAVVQSVSGCTWHEVFAQRVAGPLRLTHTVFGDGRTRNPWLAGGARSTLADMQRFLQLQLTRGCAGSTRVLSEWALAEMLRDQTGDARILVSPFDDGRRYGLGVWLDRIDADGRTLRAGSHGGAGSIPWFDVDSRYAAHLFVYEPDHEGFHGFRSALAVSDDIDPLLRAIAAAGTAAEEGSSHLPAARDGLEDVDR